MSKITFHEWDECYSCAECGVTLRFCSWLNSVCEIGAGNTVLSENHICNISTPTKRNDDIGLGSMQAERAAQLEHYGQFYSSAQFTKEREQDVKKRQKQAIQQSRKRGSLSQEQRQRIGDAVREAKRGSNL